MYTIDYSQDYYSTLNISINSTQAIIKSQYRKMANVHHPDKGGDPEIFRKINEAYEILSNVDSRRLYDKRFIPKEVSSFKLPITFRESLTGTNVSTHLGVINVPAGVNSGDRIKHVGNTIEITVERDPNFNRDGDDLFMTLDVSSLLAITGGKMEFENAVGTQISLSIPTLMKNNAILCARGQGVPSKKGCGDLYIKCIIDTPSLTEEEVAAIVAAVQPKTL